MESDHKPLEVIFKKPLHRAPKRLQRKLMRTQMYNINLGYRKGSTMHLADTLSRAYLPYDGSQEVASEIESVNMTQYVRLKPSTLQEIKVRLQEDDSFQELIRVIEAGWPETKGVLWHLVLPFFDIRDELSVYDGVVIRGERVVVPMSLRRDTLRRLHYAQSGVVSILSQARESIYTGRECAVKSSSLLKGVKYAGRLTGSSQRRHSFLMKFPTGHGRKSS